MEMLEDKEVERMLTDLYKASKTLDDLSEKITNWSEELDEMIKSLMLTAQKISDMPKPKYKKSNPVENVYKNIEEIRMVYVNRIKRARNTLQDAEKKDNLLEKWIKEAKLDEVEEKIIEYTYKNRMITIVIARDLGYSERSIKYKRKEAIDKLKKVCTLLH